MTTSYTVNYTLALTVRKRFAMTAASRATLVYDAFNTQGAMSATSTPAAGKAAALSQALTSGAATLDLTNLTDADGSSVNGNGLKVQAVLIQNPPENSNPLVITPGASDGYDLFASGAQITLNPGESFCWVGSNSGNVPSIDSTHKTLDLSDGGAAGAESHNLIIVMG